MHSPNFFINPSEATYENVVENLEWMEDKGRFSRYYIGEESSVWVCNDCQCHAANVDPYEETCECE